MDGATDWLAGRGRSPLPSSGIIEAVGENERVVIDETAIQIGREQC